MPRPQHMNGGMTPSSPHYGLNFAGHYLAIGSPLNAIILEFFGHANDSISL